MTRTLALALPNFQDTFTVETDACQPIAYLSKALGEKHKSLSIYGKKKEFLALTMGIEKWRYYLQRPKCILGWGKGRARWAVRGMGHRGWELGYGRQGRKGFFFCFYLILVYFYLLSISIQI